MSSTEHAKELRCSKCGERGTVRVNRKPSANQYLCECICGHEYISTSTAAGAAYQKYLDTRDNSAIHSRFNVGGPR